MTDEPITTVPEDQDKPQEPQAPSAEEGQAESDQQPSTLPDKFKGKSAEDIAKSYLELEKKIGEQSKEAGEAKKLREEVEQWQRLGAIIENDPVLLSALQTKVKGNSQDEEPSRDDTRVALEQQIIGNFEREKGINSLSDDKRGSLYQNIATELQDMIDPSGKMSTQEIIDSIPLDRLPKYLEKAYKLATVGDSEEQARVQGLIQARQNNEASFGSIPASGGQSQIQLSEEERKIARRMNISEKEYLENKDK